MTRHRASDAFCTITTSDYWPYVLALNESILAFEKTAALHVLVTDAVDTSHLLNIPGNISTYTTAELCGDGVGKRIFDKYHAHQMDNFRWSMKSVFIHHLLTSAGHQKVIYVDNDVHFFDSMSFLFDALDTSAVLLSPHWRASDPTKDRTNFICMFTSGIFNGGFVGVSRQGTEAMQWWAQCCAEFCEIDPCKGQFVDQTHLNLMPVFFDNVEILKHRGCNVANWNQIECLREQSSGGAVTAGGYPIVFIHFTPSTIRGILSGKDSLLRSHLELFASRLKRFGRELPFGYTSASADASGQSHLSFALKTLKTTFRMTSRIRHLFHRAGK